MTTEVNISESLNSLLIQMRLLEFVLKSARKRAIKIQYKVLTNPGKY
ncbi:hypothetical protein [Hufsiella ginkgonis]|uniref:Uncharacterized protein n=1 Tax=Hufsiella ginkgonis TaxID=2695274 RepID=A0A7K1Y1H2_9SPHI|nr:hypothetical protein [Hufsiella ginkgonis]MXV16869.1 hypothetical protein [Hufsiella ginkgonis]